MLSIEIVLVVAILFFLVDLLIIWSDFIPSRRFLKEMEENIKEVYEINASIKEKLNEVPVSDKSNS